MAQATTRSPSPASTPLAPDAPARSSSASRGFWSSSWHRFRRDRVSMLALAGLALIVVVTVAAPWIAR